MDYRAEVAIGQVEEAISIYKAIEQLIEAYRRLESENKDLQQKIRAIEALLKKSA